MTGRIALLATLALLFPTPLLAATVAELEAWCAPADQGGRPSLCNAYLETNLELLASPDPSSNGGRRVCVPPQEDRAHVIGLIRDYVTGQPEARSQDSVEGLGLALQGHFPCSGK